MHAQHTGISDSAENAGAINSQCPAGARTLVAASQQLAEVIAHPGQRQLEVVITERDREVAALLRTNLVSAGPAGRRPGGRRWLGFRKCVGSSGFQFPTAQQKRKFVKPAIPLLTSTSQGRYFGESSSRSNGDGKDPMPPSKSY